MSSTDPTVANPALLTLADVYRHFVFDAQTQRQQELMIVQLIGQTIETTLRHSLATYFDHESKPATA